MRILLKKRKKRKKGKKKKRNPIQKLLVIQLNEYEIIKATKWGAFQTDWRMFKYFRPDFYKDFLGKTSSCSATKIQAAVRGHQTRKKYKKGGIGKKSRRNIR